jgi:hypothetical protein
MGSSSGHVDAGQVPKRINERIVMQHSALKICPKAAQLDRNHEQQGLLNRQLDAG